MKKFILISILLLIWVIPSSAQNTQNIQKKKPLEFKWDGNSKDSLKRFNIPLLDSLDKSIEIPNAYKGQKGLLSTPNAIQKQQDDTMILEKKLTGGESVRMPGTQKLEEDGKIVKQNPETLKSPLIKK